MRFSVNMNGMMQIADELEGHNRKLDNYKYKVLTVRNNCPGTGSTRRMLVNSLDGILEEIENEKNIWNSLTNILEESGNYYRVYEEKISKCESGASIGWGDIDIVPVPIIDPDRLKPIPGVPTPNILDYIPWSNIWEMVSKAGFIGGAFSTVANLVTGGFTQESLLSSAGFVNEIVGNGADLVNDGVSANWKKYLWGGKDALDNLPKSSWGQTFKGSIKTQFIDDLGFNGATTTADKVKIGSAWAGHIITLGTNAVDNYEEFKEEGTAGLVRGTAETILETGVDIGLGALSTAAVSATVSASLAAIGVTVAAPAIVIGIGAVAVTWAANSVCEWITGGDDIGEVVANVVCDVGEGAVNIAKKGIEKAGEIAQDIGNGIKKGASTLWKGICGAFG